MQSPYSSSAEVKLRKFDREAGNSFARFEDGILNRERWAENDSCQHRRIIVMVMVERIFAKQRENDDAKVDFCSFIFWTRRKILQLLIPNSSEHSKIDPSNGEEKRESAWRKEQRMKRGKGSGSRTRSITRNEWAFLESMHDPSVAEDASAFSISFFFWGRPSPWAKRENFSFHASEQRNFSALVTEESKFQDNVVWTITKKFGQLEIFSFFLLLVSSLLLHVSLFLFLLIFHCSMTSL